jgi:hypothetical protein
MTTRGVRGHSAGNCLGELGSPRRADGLLSASSPRGPRSESRLPPIPRSATPSEGAGVRRGVWRVIRAIGADWVINPAVETTPSHAKVLVVDVRHGLTSTKANNVASAKAAHMATTTAASGLCPRGKKAPGQHCACQDRNHSSSHDILHFDGRILRRRSLSDLGVSQQSERQGRDRMEMRVLSRTL